MTNESQGDSAAWGVSGTRSVSGALTGCLRRWLVGRLQAERGVLGDHANAVAAVLLGLVQRRIRGCQQVGKLSTGAAVPSGSQRGDADRDAEPDRLGTGVVVYVDGHGGNVSPDAFRDAVGIYRLGLG